MEKQLIEKQQHEEQLSGRENMHRIIAEWKKGREQDEKERAERLASPEFKKSIEQLKKENAKRGINIPGL